MSAAPLTHPLLAACGVEHGFGQRGSPAPPALLRLRQVHGAEAVRAGPGATPPEADAIVSALPGRAVGVLTADCVPVLLSTRCGRAVAAVHAGWRGLAAGVVAAAVRELRSVAPGGAPLVAVSGPHIGLCCYEVDAPVVEAMRARFGPGVADALRPARPGRHHLDLGQLVYQELRAADLAPESITSLPDACTHCDAERFHSYRRDGPGAGRLVHFVAAAR